MLSFDANSHTYWDGSRRVPSVTEILKPLYGDLRFVAQDLLDYKSELGQAVHKAVELYAKKKLDFLSLTAPVNDYFYKFLEFEVDTDFQILESETRVHNATMGYAGTLDLIGMLNGVKSLIDVKTTTVLSPVVALQTSAYQKAYNLDKPKEQHALKRYALRLSPDKYRLEPYTQDVSDFGVFSSLLILHNWCNRNNKKVELVNE